MSLQVLPIQPEDFEVLASHAWRFPIGDDLVANPVPTCWPVSNTEEATTRARWHFARQRERFLNDETATFIKVVDTSNNCDIISLARWHFYSHGYRFKDHGHWEVAISHDQGDFQLHNTILTSRDRHRETWILPNDAPCWILTHLVTRQSQRRRGAAQLLLQWGLDKSDETGAPAYLESGVMGVELYKSMGFQEVGRPMEVKLKADQPPFKMASMAYFPSSNIDSI